MKSSLKKSLYVGLTAASMLGVAGLISTTASAKSGAYLRYYQNIPNKTVSVTNQNATVYTTGRLSHKAGTMRSYGSKVEEYYTAHVTKNGKASVYYKFRVGKKTGWVWHGYLKSSATKVGTTAATTPATTTASTTPTSNNSLTFKYVDAYSGKTVASTSWIIPSNLLKSGVSVSEGVGMKSILKDITSVLTAATADTPTEYDLSDTRFPNVVTSKVGETLTFHVVAQN